MWRRQKKDEPQREVLHRMLVWTENEEDKGKTYHNHRGSIFDKDGYRPNER